jgi:DNA repair protein RecN (Recombination protein N)
VIRALEIRDLVVIERAHLEPSAGLTAVTGETGAGKTVLAQALALLGGAPADPRGVRPGARSALVQATLAVPPGLWDAFDEDDPARGLREAADDENEVVLARRVPAEGRARALLDGQVVSREAAGSLLGALVRVSGQHDHRRLVGSAAQAAVLDAFAGPDAQAAAAGLRRERARLRRARRALAAARERREAAEREREHLEDLVATVDAAGIDPAEEDALRAERSRLMHAGRLADGASAAAAELVRDGDGAMDALARAEAAVAPLVEVDEALRPVRDDLAAAAASLAEASLGLGGYLAALDADPGRRDEVEGRLEVYARLIRRHGGDASGLLARADEARERLRELGEGEAGLAGLAAEVEAALGAGREAAARLRELRAAAAPLLEEAVTAELAELGMPSARVRVGITPGADDPPADRVELMLRANPGLPEAPLADTASGGELSRVLLALHGVAAAADPGVGFVFDEVDAGVGGVTAAAVGRRLAALARDRQVIVITHLPQVAAHADRHYRLVKGEGDDGRARTVIEPVADGALVDELCRMLGAGPRDAGARRHARELLARRAS